MLNLTSHLYNQTRTILNPLSSSYNARPKESHPPRKNPDHNFYSQSTLYLGAATGCQGVYLFFTVLYGLYSDLEPVRTGLCSVGSQARTLRCMMGSCEGGLSTM